MRPKQFVIVIITVLSALIFPRTGSTHDPITTKVMFNREIIRIFQGSCLGCHSVGKIEGDIPLTTYEEARPWAKAIKEEVLEKRMMPYQAVKGYGFFRHDYVLPQRELELIVSWVEGGAPRGEEKDYPKQAIDWILSGENWALGQPDLILAPEKETEIAAKGPKSEDEVRCFSLPMRAQEDRWITAFDFQPGNGAVVYSASFFIDSAGRNKNDGDCRLNSGTANPESLGVWIPGQIAERLPEGAGRLLPANSRILMKIHYRKNGEATTDRSRLGLYFAKDRIEKVAHTITLGPHGANAANGRVRVTHTVTDATEAISIRPLLFPYTESLEARAYHPDGSIEVLIWARSYRYDWQPSYYFRRPMALPKGTRIEVTAYLNGAETKKLPEAFCEITLTAISERTSQHRPSPHRPHPASHPALHPALHPV